MELDQRKLRVLAAIVETYTATGEPVSSKMVSYLLGGQVSSATVRNDMAALFDLGLIEQPHTSAGRIPSHLGYRVYVDRLMNCRPLDKEEKDRIDALFNIKYPDPEKLLEDAAQALADQTGCATISTTFTPHSVAVKRVELIPVGESTVVILLIATNGVIKNKVCRVDFKITQPILEFFQSFANGRLAGKSLGEISGRYINSAATALGEYSRIFNPILSAIFELCREVNNGQYFQSGSTNLLGYEEFQQIAHDLLELLERRQDMMNLISPNNTGVEIKIGRENAPAELASTSFVVVKYPIGKDNMGALGLIGPVRLDYPRLIPHLEYFAEALGRILSESFE